MSSISSLSDSTVRHKGSGAHVIAGLIILIVGLALSQSIVSAAVVYVSATIGIAIMISAFLMIIKQIRAGNNT